MPEGDHLREQMERWCIERTRWRSPEGLRRAKERNQRTVLDDANERGDERRRKRKRTSKPSQSRPHSPSPTNSPSDPTRRT